MSLETSSCTYLPGACILIFVVTTFSLQVNEDADFVGQVAVRWKGDYLTSFCLNLHAALSSEDKRGKDICLPLSDPVDAQKVIQ